MDEPDARPTGARRWRLTIGASVVLVLLGISVAVVVAAIGPHGGAESIGVSAPGGTAPGTSAPGSAAPGGAAPGGAAPGGAAPGSGAAAAGERAGGGRVGDASGGSTPVSRGNERAGPPLFVHILGEVNAPGLYELHDGDRAIDAVAAAGGLTDAADEGQVNLARFLRDGEQILVPAVGQVPAPPRGAAPGGGAAGGTSAGELVNLNTADAAMLETLPGVGPALAQRIIDWREANGSFTSVDDLSNVEGIGTKKLAGLIDAATT